MSRRSPIRTALLTLSLLACAAVSCADTPPPAPELPDVELVDADGNPVRFYTDLVKDKVVAINFIFTSCEVVCPILGVNFAGVQRALPARIGNDLHLLSVSIDPATDTPARLSAWRRKVGGAAAGWTLVTGDKGKVDTVLKALQVFSADRTDHSTFVVLGNDARGAWRRVNGLSSAEVIRRELEALAGPGPATSARR